MPPTPEQPHLNGAYYGPPIQPKTKSYYSRGRGGGGGGMCCNPLTCCCSCICSCILNLICQILLTVGIFLAVVGLICWFIFRPNVPKFHVDDAALTQFTLSPTNDTLYYNLAVNMTFRNPNRRLGIYYDKIEASALYHGQRFATADVQGFYLGHKKENNVTAVFKGEQLVVLGGGDKSKYDSEKNDDVYNIDLKLRLKIRFKVWWAKTPKFKPNFECDLKVPLNSKGHESKTSEDPHLHTSSILLNPHFLSSIPDSSFHLFHIHFFTLVSDRTLPSTLAGFFLPPVADLICYLPVRSPVSPSPIVKMTIVKRRCR